MARNWEASMSTSESSRTHLSDTVAQEPTPGTEWPWLRHYAAGTPPTVAVPDSTVADILRETARKHPDRRAIAFYGNHISYKELDRASSAFANRLIEHGLRRGDRVLVILPNLPQFLIAHFGILKAGGTVAALSPLLVEREIADLAADADARIIVVLDRMWEKVQPLVARGLFTCAIVTSVQDGLPTLKRLLFPIAKRKEVIAIPHDPARGVWRYRAFLKGASRDDPRVPVGPDDVAAFQYTGGTTGLPKAAVLTHRNLVANVLQTRAWFYDAREAQETLMAIIPFFHSYGVTLCLHLGVQIAATNVLVPRFDIKDVMEQIATYQPTLLPGVPTLYNAITGAAEKNPERKQSLTSIRYCFSGGAPLPAAVRERFEELTGGALVEGYGLSEASPVTHANPLDGRARNGFIGLPVSNTEARIVDIETRAPLPPGERGELAIRGPQIMREYWKRPSETAAVLEDGWLYTGDVAIMDEDGFFKIVDRQKDVIITGGENVYPREIEEVLYTHPKIAEAAVVAVEHAVAGQVAKAFIVVKPGETLDRREVLQYTADRLAKYKQPRLVEFRDALPKAGTGKILKRELIAAEAGAGRKRRQRGAAPETAAHNGDETPEE
jgi:long-chain acyl-CoA synthetase